MSVPYPMPSNFPMTAFDEVLAWAPTRVVPDTVKTPAPSHPARDALVNAWLGVAARCLAAHNANERFTMAFLPGHEDRFVRDSEAFTFFASAVSCIECFCFGAHHIGAVCAPLAFSLDDGALRGVHPKAVRQAFERTFPADDFTNVLARMIDDAEYESLKERRDVLSHWGIQSRLHVGVTVAPGVQVAGVAPPLVPRASRKPGDLLGALDGVPENELTRVPMTWLTLQLSLLMAAVAGFCSRHAPIYETTATDTAAS